MNITDREVVRALLQRDARVTRDFFYRKCYPLFKSVYDNYHTDCSSCMEFISEIYVHIMTPDKAGGQCKLEGFRYQSTLFTWLKAVCLFYCYKRYERRTKMPTEQISEKFDGQGVRIDTIPASIELDRRRRNHTEADAQQKIQQADKTAISMRTHQRGDGHDDGNEHEHLLQQAQDG